MKKIINHLDFKKFFGTKKLPRIFLREIKINNLKYRALYNHENEKILNLLKTTLKDKKLKKSGKKYKKKWNIGWNENLNLLKKNRKNALIPKYFNKYKYARIGGKIYKTETNLFDYKLLKLITSYIFIKYFKNSSQVLEFGSGTGHNLLNLNRFNISAKLHALDWAQETEKICNILKKDTSKDINIEGHAFDYFNPKINFPLDKNWTCFTVASLEQVGLNYKKFINMLIKKKPKLVVNLEPIAELLDKKNELENLSIKYFLKRNYLKDYLKHLKKMEKEKKIKIIKTRKSYFGSLYINGYSLIVWKPII